MKIERKKEAFEPIVITLETEKEATLLRLIFGNDWTIARELANGEALDEYNIHEAIIDSNLWRKLDAFGISSDYDKFFGKKAEE